jgi:phosphate transport system permease protein
MNALIVAAVLLLLFATAWQSGWSRSNRLVTTDGVKIHSRPQYHAAYTAIWTMLPALLILGAWGIFGGGITHDYIISLIPPDILSTLNEQSLTASMNRIRNLASGFAVVSALLYARSQITARLRARNAVERFVSFLLLACSAVAILTTVGIVASLFVEAMRFFSFVSPLDFFFGTVWNPNNAPVGDDYGSYGLLPLLSGTLMITAIAMVVAVPIGLMAAIYLSQYAPRRVRAFVKPVIEILAGIPTIVYGFFALVAVGPFLRDAGALVGIPLNATSALTAGIVMGIMIIPFVSSLSDDILTQLPRSLKDGAYGLGATPSETIRSVLLPAALPGIVGAFLLAVSRAIGETMIVVLAAGNSPVLRGNPFEPVATITVSIVNQLTGDTDFAGPQSLVGFALGLTLFVITLGLNIVALFIVRRFREQYE